MNLVQKESKCKQCKGPMVKKTTSHVFCTRNCGQKYNWIKNRPKKLNAKRRYQKSLKGKVTQKLWEIKNRRKRKEYRKKYLREKRERIKLERLKPKIKKVEPEIIINLDDARQEMLLRCLKFIHINKKASVQQLELFMIQQHKRFLGYYTKLQFIKIMVDLKVVNETIRSGRWRTNRTYRIKHKGVRFIRDCKTSPEFAWIKLKE